LILNFLNSFSVLHIAARGADGNTVIDNSVGEEVLSRVQACVLLSEFQAVVSCPAVWLVVEKLLWVNVIKSSHDLESSGCVASRSTLLQLKLVRFGCLSLFS
jgi:hypothetical protein